MDGLIVLMFLLGGGMIWAAIWMAKQNKANAESVNEERQVFERIMRHGTDEQKLIALQLQQNKNLDALRGLVLFDIFFD